MSEYNPKDIEKKWQQSWEENKVYKTEIDKSKPKFYALDMFPYPSGAGLHVGHPLGYIASDIIARYKRLKGFNVLHPMGFDSFGLPAEQYAIQTGQHPAVTTEQNINTFKKQLRNIGFSYDWEREVRTSSPDFYKWTQWIFLKLFGSWFNKNTDKAESIETLIQHFEKSGTAGLNAHADADITQFTADEWKAFSEKEQQQILLNYRLAYLKNMTVNWCPALGTVLANDEVKDGVSERGGYPVIKKEMQQWAMRITAYAERLLQGLEEIDWSEALKEMQRNWIGKSLGCEVTFELEGNKSHGAGITVFTTRIDTIYGVSYLVLAPENEMVADLITDEYREEAEKYVEMAKNRSERDRQSDVKTVSGAFTGSYAINPFNGEKIPVWIADYVLAGYGTGAVMGVPSSDDRDWRFATHFNLPIILVIEGTENLENPTEVKYGKMINSGFLNGLSSEEAIQKAIEFVEQKGIGKGKVNYRMRDAIFARQRYWGEPIPIYFKEGIPYPLPESELPLILPEVDKYLPTEDGEPPLGRAKNWEYNGYPLELNTMPGWAGSSWYWYRYMDAQNDKEFASREKIDYWQDLDLYLGGAEHATGHLLYSRFWNHFLFDLGLVPKKEYAKKLINQGMISGRSSLAFRLKTNFIRNSGFQDVQIPQFFISYHRKLKIEKGIDIENEINQINEVINNVITKINSENNGLDLKISRDFTEFSSIHTDIHFVENDILDIEKFRNWRPDLANAEFIFEKDSEGKEVYICGSQPDKMSKRYYNAVDPDEVVEEYGADTLRLYEMFLGPLEQSKPWDTKGIDGVFRFLRKLWRLFYNEQGKFLVTDEAPTPAELKVLHKTIRKIEEDLEKYTFNTGVSAFMVCVNELKDLNCSKKAILQELLIILSPYAPHIAEELYSRLEGGENAQTPSLWGRAGEGLLFPKWNMAYIQESDFDYPISINGKVRTKITFSLDTTKEEIEKSVLASEVVQKYLEGKSPKKVIVVEKKIVNVVI
jgi:leucyl-tRNA synthetase